MNDQLLAQLQAAADEYRRRSYGENTKIGRVRMQGKEEGMRTAIRMIQEENQ